MSRSAETIEDAINQVLFKPVHSLEEVGKRILDNLLKMHSYTDHAEVSLAGDLILLMKNGEAQQGQKPFELSADVEVDKKPDGSLSYRGKVGISAYGMTCCPCAQEMNMEYIQQIVASRKDIKITSEDLEKLLKIIPVASHNQRALGKIQIGFDNLDKEIINVLDLIEVIESSMSGRIQAVLKRPDEAELVRSAHFNPVFAEDSVRRMASRLCDPKFDIIPDKSSVQISILSYESIHIHNVYGEIVSTFGKIRQELRKN
jgi:GTP cyclohydrolase-4